MSVAYYRVSTQRQGQSGLGLEAQRHAVRTYLGAAPGDEFTDVESGKRDDRPGLRAALDLCRLTGRRLVIAKLDRLSRDAAFLLTLQNSDVEFVCCDMPDANRLTIGIMALIAQHEREAISARTKAALQAAKARGVKLGNPNVEALRRGQRKTAKILEFQAVERYRALADRLALVRAAGNTSLREIARAFNEAGVLTPRGGAWHAQTVSRLLRAIGE